MEINPQLLDLTIRDKDYIIFYGDSPLLTPAGNEFIHTNPRLLQFIITELSVSDSVPSEGITSYRLFSYQKDFIDAGNDLIMNSLQQKLTEDYFVKLKFGTESGNDLDVSEKIDFLLDNRQKINFIFGGSSSIVKSLNKFLGENGILAIQNSEKSFEKFINFIKENYSWMDSSKKSAVYFLNKVHNAGILLPILLVSKKISPSEYTNSVLNIYLNNFSAHRKEIEELEHSFGAIHRQAFATLEYLSFFDNLAEKVSEVLEIINTGEGANIEFKSSLRWNIKEGKKDSAIEHASLKTISAFLNSNGGNLFIGVRDDGSIEGIETDAFDNDDKFQLHFWNLIKASLGEEHSPYIHSSLEKISDKTVCVVKCLKSPAPVFLHQKGFDEEFYIRVGPSSAKLGVQDTYKYIAERFK